MSGQGGTRRAVGASLVVAMLAACQSYSPVSLPARQPPEHPIRAELSVGDDVRLVLTDHRVVEVRVAALERDDLVGERGERVAYADVVAVERRGLDFTKTYLLYVAVFALALLVAGCAASC